MRTLRVEGTLEQRSWVVYVSASLVMGAGVGAKSGSSASFSAEWGGGITLRQRNAGAGKRGQDRDGQELTVARGVACLTTRRQCWREG